jgi:hypothetical protein
LKKEGLRDRPLFLPSLPLILHPMGELNNVLYWHI